MQIDVRTSNGPIRGAQEDGLTVFRGIPFAAPPIGDLRFRAPLLPAPWQDVRDATRFGNAAIQPPPVDAPLLGRTAPVDVEPFSEDCLYLNVWTPAEEPRAKLPVMVWIHGGAFRTGSGSSPNYRGENLARHGNCIVVTTNYRMGLLGFLYLPEIADANCGILDQVAALRWVQDNIAAFGGDPGNVTIFGESAGAKSVEVLMAMPSARGLFHRAILQSTYDTVMDPGAASEYADGVLAQLGIDRSEPERLRDVSAEDLLAATIRHDLATGGTSGGRGPIIDGEVVPQEPLAAIAAGAARDIPIIVGTCRDEMSMFAAMSPAGFDIDEEVLRRRLLGLVPGAVEDPTLIGRAIEAYTASRSAMSEAVDPINIWIGVASDRTFRQHSLQLAAAQVATGAPVYMFLVNWTSPVPNLGTPHALDVALTFANFDVSTGVLAGTSDGAKELAGKVMDAWSAFARGGKPRSLKLPDWPLYDTTSRQTLLLDGVCEVVSAPREAERVFWEEIGTIKV